MNVCVTHSNSCITEDTALWEHSGSVLQTPTEVHRTGQPLKPLIFSQVKWHADPEGWWQFYIAHAWHTGHAPAPPHCWHTGEIQQHGTGGHFDIPLLPQDTFYTPSQQTSHQSSISKPDLWCHSPVSSYPPKICVTSSGKRIRHLKVGSLQL